MEQKMSLIDDRGELDYERAFHEGEDDREEFVELILFEIYWESVGGRAEYDLMLDAWQAGREQMRLEAIVELEKRMFAHGFKTEHIEFVTDFFRRMK